MIRGGSIYRVNVARKGPPGTPSLPDPIMLPLDDCCGKGATVLDRKLSTMRLIVKNILESFGKVGFG